MTQFHKNQEVEVSKIVSKPGAGWTQRRWRKAKIIRLPHAPKSLDDGRKYQVQFPDGSRGVYDEQRIRAADPRDERFARAPKGSTEADHRTMLAGDSAEKDEA